MHRHRALNLGGWAIVLAGALAHSPSGQAQQKTGPGVPADDSITWNGVTLYGVVDVGLQYDTRSAPFTPYRPAASGNIVRPNDRESVFGLTPSNMGQSRIGLQGNEPIGADWAGVFQIETFFNPQSGELADSLKSLAANNGRPLAEQSVGVDGSSAGQAFQTAFVGLSSLRFGALSFGRQVTLLSEGTIEYDPNYLATAFGLLGASNTYSGGGSSENNRLDSTLKYGATLGDRLRVAGLYKFKESGGSANTAWQADLGWHVSFASVDGYYSKISRSVTASSLTTAQVSALPALGYSATNSLAATVSDNTTYALMGFYRHGPIKLMGGYENIRYDNPAISLRAGSRDIGGYLLAFASNDAYAVPKVVQVYWTGVRYAVSRHLELTAAYYGVHQSAYGTGAQAGCSTRVHSDCSGRLEAISVDVDYRFNVRFDAYFGSMYSAAHEGIATGYLHTSNVNPTLGARYKF